LIRIAVERANVFLSITVQDKQEERLQLRVTITT